MSLLDIIAVGARTPVGFTAESSAAAVRAGIPGFYEFPFLSLNDDLVIVAADPEIAADTPIKNRLLTMAESSINEVFCKLDRHISCRGRCFVLLSLPETRPGFSDEDAEWVVNTLKAKIPPMGRETHVVIGGRGHAGGIEAIGHVVQELSGDVKDLFLVVGVDSYHSGETFIWLEENLQFAQPPVIRAGFIPGEAAGCIALKTHSQTRQQSDFPILATVAGIGIAQETLLRTSDSGSFGVGMSEAVIGATESLHLPGECVDTVYSDINGERYRSEEWGFVAMRTPSVWKSLTYEAPSDCWGDVGAAYAPLSIMLTTQSYVREYSRGPRTMVLAGSESGLRGVLLLQDPKVN